MSLSQATAVTGALLGFGGVVGTLVRGAFSEQYDTRWKGGRIVDFVVWAGVIFSILILTSFVVGPPALSLTLQFFVIVAERELSPRLAPVMLDVVPAVVARCLRFRPWP